jgi:hypothetical protein
VLLATAVTAATAAGVDATSVGRTRDIAALHICSNAAPLRPRRATAT